MAKFLRWELGSRDATIRRSHQLLAEAKGGNAAEAWAWQLQSDQGKVVLSHSGGSFGMSSQMVLYPEEGEGFVLLANDACQGTEGDLKALALSIKSQTKE